MYCIKEDYCRIAVDRNKVLIYNPVGGMGIHLNKKAYKIYCYIRDQKPNYNQIQLWAKSENIDAIQIDKMLTFLKENQFLHEV